MKIVIILVTLISLLLIVQLVIVMSTNKIETQTYTVVRKLDNFEIRYYPAANMAMITSESKSYRDLGSSGFGTLANFIFGGNNENQKIAMTSPVHLEIGDSISTMAFVMPAEFKKDDLPLPDDPNIMIRTSAPEYVAAIEFGGYASTSRINRHKVFLEESLQRNGLSYHGNFRFLGYSPPFQVINRKNEVIVAINANDVNKMK